MKHYLTGLLIGAMAIPLVAKAVDEIAQTPLFVTDSVPPLNMLVMGRDHKLYYEAYNDASDLNNDGVLDIGYKGYKVKSLGGIDYYGYFNSKLCYSYTDDRFVPTTAGTGTTGKECSNQWSGDFLNYLATSRMDALRKVLYGGYRSTDESGTTVLRGAYIPEDAHTWGKEYTSNAVDGYDISHFAPLEAPLPGYRHLIAVTSLSDNGIPQLRVLTNVNLRIWNWVSIERPVGGDNCVNAKGTRGRCVGSGPGGWTQVPPSSFKDLTIRTWVKSDSNHPDSTDSMDRLFRTDATNLRLCGSQSISNGIYSYGADNNPFNGMTTPGNLACGNDYYITEISGKLRIDTPGRYEFSVDGDDAVDVKIGDRLVASWYGGHGATDQGNADHSSSRVLEAGEYDIVFRHEEVGGGDAWGLYWQPPGNSVTRASRTDYNIQVEVCPNDTNSTNNAGLRETNCKRYPDGDYKPTGILHDYGETNKMYFGLLSGSYKNHFYGGVLRSNIQSFARELNSRTGQFCLDGNCGGAEDNVQGIVDTINRFRTVGFNYGNFMYDCGFGRNPTSDLAGDPCYMWGTPTAEMMYETLRYFAGASGPTPAFNYSSTDTGVPDNQLGLAHPAWIAPYARGNGESGYPRCSVPAMTVLSDIYPNYDWKLPGSRWENSITSSGDPAPLTNLNVATETDAIGEAERLNGTTVFIGETKADGAPANADNAPTQKTLPSLSRIRGLAPEEPSKQGTYYSAGIARFAAMHNIGGSKPLITYAVALASPFPKIEFPVGNNKITLVPFAKSVHDPDSREYSSTNQIADFYVQKLANTTDDNTDSSVNEGRAYAEFRINWEDSEEGADFDMDAIVLYTLAVVPDPADGGRLKLRITLNSEYAAGINKQHMGYTISGTDHDGLYLEVCDLRDGTVNNGQRDVCDGQTRYRLNTPPNRPAGWCINNLSNDECRGLPPTATRTFTATGIGAGVLKDPLWYAAKYGIPDNNWDTNNDGVPDNYLLVTNALTLKDQLNKAFSNVIQRNSSITRVTVQTNRDTQGSQTGHTVYRTIFNADDWTGNLIKETYTNGTTAPTVLNASIPTTGRVVKMAGTGDDGLQNFTYDNLRGRTFGGQDLQALMDQNPSGNTDGLGADRVRFLLSTCTSTNCTNNFRTRNSLLGDIVNSSPVRVGAPNYLAYRVNPVDGSYAAFQTAQASRRPQIYVGANDGMLHAFDAATLVEKFAFVPTPVIPKLNRLMARGYGTSTSHQYYVDGRLTTADVYFDSEWHTVLVGTLGGGGRGLFALDITDPDRIKLLWEFTSDSSATVDATTHKSNLGYNFGPPTITRLHTGDWAAVFGNGYYSDNADSGKAILYAVKINNGTLIKAVEATSPTTSSNGLSAVQVADYNGDIVADAAYAGDLLGNLWRFDLTSRNTTSPFTRSSDGSSQADAFTVAFGGAPLYSAKTNDQQAGSDAGRPQTITAAPVLIQHPTLKGYLVTFATGRYLSVNDKVEPFDIQTVYGIWDRWTLGQETNAEMVSGHNRASLQQQTITSATYTSGTVTRNVRTFSANAVDWYGNGTRDDDSNVNRWGWYADLKLVGTSTNTGERVIFPLKTLGDTLLFTSITPNADACSAGIDSTLYGIDGKTGGQTRYHVFDLNHDGKIDASDSVAGSTVVSGIEGTLGDNTLAGNQTLDSNGSPTLLSSGPKASGRQSWRLLPPPAP